MGIMNKQKKDFKHEINRQTDKNMTLKQVTQKRHSESHKEITKKQQNTTNTL